MPCRPPFGSTTERFFQLLGYDMKDRLPSQSRASVNGDLVNQNQDITSENQATIVREIV